MLATILSAFTVKEIRKKLLFTAALLALYRLGSHIPVPGINAEAVDSVQSQFGGGGILNLLNTFSGGALSQLALFALGIMPYITASIILQLLTVVVPSLEKLSKEGEVGQQRITQYTRYLTVGLACAQSGGYVFRIKCGATGPVPPQSRQRAKRVAQGSSHPSDPEIAAVALNGAPRTRGSTIVRCREGADESTF